MKTHSILVIVLSVLIGAIVFISTDCAAPPSSNGTSGGDTNGGGTGGGGTNGGGTGGGGTNGGGSTSGTFSVANEYIDFHSWYGEITWTGSSTLDPALIVVSTNATPKQWDGSATLGAQGELTAAGITGVAVDAVYSRKFDAANLKTRKIYAAVNDTYTKNANKVTPTDVGEYVISDTSDPNIAWTLQANTSYSLIIYYKEGKSNDDKTPTPKSFVHSFTTPAYPTNAEEAKRFGGDVAVSGLFNNGLATTQAGAIELKANERLATSFGIVHNQQSTLMLQKHDKTNSSVLVCRSPPTVKCDDLLGEDVVFQFLVHKDMDPGAATFFITDALIYPSFAELKTVDGSFTGGLKMISVDDGTLDRYFTQITE